MADSMSSTASAIPAEKPVTPPSPASMAAKF